MPQLLNPVPKWVLVAFLVVSFLGFLDATYLTIEHFRGVIPPCTFLSGCEKVTTSEYSVVLGVPVALGGSVFYLLIFILTTLYFQFKRADFLKYIFYLSILGFLASLTFVYIQLFVIEAICIYCMFSVLTSTAIFGLSLWVGSKISLYQV